MSNFLAIGGVSATLQALLRDRIELPPGVTRADLQVTVAIPQSEESLNPEPPRVNLFLYRVTENAALKNQEIPGQGHPAEFGRPPLSLILHYMVTAYGATDDNGIVNETTSHFLLGSAMRVLHDHPVVTESLTTIQAPTGVTILHSSLRGEFEQVKLCLDPISLEDLAKVWTALTRPYRVSAAYTISVVQIESRRRRSLAAPVKTRRIHMSVSRRPQADAVYRTPVAPGETIGDIRARVLQELTIEGSRFRARRVWVKLGGLEPLQVAPVSDTLVRVTIPNDIYPPDDDHPLPRPIPVSEQLRPGPQAVEVITQRPTEVVQGGLDNGTVVLDDNRQHSNQLVFLLTPEITGVAPPNGPIGTILTVTGNRLFGGGVRSVVLIGDVAIPVQAPGPGDPWAAPTDTSVQVPVAPLALATPPVPPGIYPVRVMVNGVQNMEDRSFQLT